MKRISVQQAARELSISDIQLRALMQEGRLPIGVVHVGNGRSTYIIYEEFVEAYKRGDRV